MHPNARVPRTEAGGATREETILDRSHLQLTNHVDRLLRYRVEGGDGL